MQAWNIAVEHAPALAGLYRGVGDFSRALNAPILSFCRDGGGGPEGPSAQPIRNVRCGWSPPGFPCLFIGRHARRLASEIVGATDLLVVHSLFRGHVAWAAAHAGRRGAQLWSVPHGCLDPWGLKHRSLLKQTWLRINGPRALGRATYTVFATTRELAKARPWTFSRSAAVIPWPVALPELGDLDAARLRFRHRLAIPESATVILSVARLHTMKRPVETIVAFQSAAAPDAHLVLAGMDGDIRTAQLETLVPADQRGHVHIVGPLFGRDLHDAWCGADAFISLSFRENFCYSLAESLGYGLPVIVSPGHDLAWDLPADRSGRWPYGWLLPDDSLRTAADAIRECVARRRTAAGITDRRSAAGRSWVAENLSPDVFRSRLYRLL